MPPKTSKKQKGKKKNNGRNKNPPTTTSVVIDAELKTEFEARVAGYTHGVIISPKPTFSAMKVAAAASKIMTRISHTKRKTNNSSAIDVEDDSTNLDATKNSNNFNEFLRHCGKSVEIDISGYDDRTNTVAVCLTLDSTTTLRMKVPSKALIEDLPSFPSQPETTKEQIERLLKHEFLSLNCDDGGYPCKIYKYRSNDIPSSDEMFLMKIGTIKKELSRYDISTTSFVEKSEMVYALKNARANMVCIEICDQPFGEKFVGGRKIVLDLIDNPTDRVPFIIVPDYDRENAEWNFINQMDIPHVDWDRGVTSCINTVPIGKKRDVYEEYIKCATTCRNDMKIHLLGDTFSEEQLMVNIELIGKEYNEEIVSFVFRKQAQIFQHGTRWDDSIFRGQGTHKYQNELKSFLLYHVMEHFLKDNNNRNSRLIKHIHSALYDSLLCLNRYKEITAITIPEIRRNVVERQPVDFIQTMVGVFGVCLEARGRLNSAAFVYAEAGAHLSKIGHPAARRMFDHAASAWKCSATSSTGVIDVETVLKAEQYCAMSLSAVRFVSYDPKEYRRLVFVSLQTLSDLYGLRVPGVCSVGYSIIIGELALASGETPPDTNGQLDQFYNRQQNLHPDLYGFDQDRIICVVQSIIDAASISGVAMRKCIHNCGRPEVMDRWLKCNVLPFSTPTKTPSNDHRAKSKHPKTNLARANLTEVYGPKIESCSSCHKNCIELKDGCKVLECQCKCAVYCDKNCQRSHWHMHKNECSAIRN